MVLLGTIRIERIEGRRPAQKLCIMSEKNIKCQKGGSADDLKRNTPQTWMGTT
jgi:hypothetical protein